jgi:hypothetical protein
MEYRYQIKYRHPRTGVGGVVMLYTALETATVRARLEAFGYVVTDVPLPIEESSTQSADSASEG